MATVLSIPGGMDSLQKCPWAGEGSREVSPFLSVLQSPKDEQHIPFPVKKGQLFRNNSPGAVRGIVVTGFT